MEYVRTAMSMYIYATYVYNACAGVRGTRFNIDGIPGGCFHASLYGTGTMKVARRSRLGELVVWCL